MRREQRRMMLAKHDGSRECFSLAKLRSCLAGVLRHCACDAQLADPLARAVASYLWTRVDGARRTTEYVFHCACAALSEAGLADAARELAAQRRLRAGRRRRTWVMASDGGRRSVMRWRKSALVATLQETHGLRAPVARFLAGHIETQVFSLGCRLVTGAFLAQLVCNEVFAWGLVDLPVQRANEVGTGDGPFASRSPEQEA